MLGGVREEGPSMDEAFKNYLEKADLTKYAVVNPNSRTISVDSKTYKFDTEKPQTSNGQDAPVLVKEELVVTRHIDAAGNELAPVELGEKTPKVLKGYNTVSTSKKDGITTHVYGVEKASVKSGEKVAGKANVANSERKLPNTGLNSVATASLGVVVLLAALALRKRKNR